MEKNKGSINPSKVLKDLEEVETDCRKREGMFKIEVPFNQAL